MIFSFSSLDFSSISELQTYLEKLQVGVLEAMARDEGSRCGVFPAARARGDIIRTFCGSSVNFHFFHDFRFFRARIFRRIWSSISGSKRISKNIFQQARSAPGSEVRGLGRALRRLYLSNPPMRQLRTEQNCPENSVTASSRSKRSRNIKVFDFRILDGF
mgnify:CR=1 FL=1